MIVHVDIAADGITEIISSFSATLVGTDLVLSTGQLLVFAPKQHQSAAIIFNYATTCEARGPRTMRGGSTR